jgi:hypothetical protein
MSRRGSRKLAPMLSRARARCDDARNEHELGAAMFAFDGAKQTNEKAYCPKMLSFGKYFVLGVITDTL